MRGWTTSPDEFAYGIDNIPKSLGEDAGVNSNEELMTFQNKSHEIHDLGIHVIKRIDVVSQELRGPFRYI